MTNIGRFTAVLLVGMAAGLVAAGSSTTARQTAARTVVIAELFTSEGCSSCPAADDLLRRLIATQPLEGVEIIALGHHVDYWDRLGWRDPFSSPLFSARQSSYAGAVFGSDRIYTPQLIVDGAVEVIGSDEPAVRQTLTKAASRPKAIVRVVVVEEPQRRARVNVQVEVPANLPTRGTADIVIAVAEDGLASHVSLGENKGRTLSHSAVVRSLTTAGHLNAGQGATSASSVVTLGSDWNTANLRIVAFVQEQTSRRIIGGGFSPLRQDR
ncbi:MAG: DUF1223 domain-containing protein [Vicinamibacterales bacterium]